MSIKERFFNKLNEVTKTSTDTNSLVKTVKASKDRKLPMDKIQNDPVLSYGYRAVKNKDYDAVDLNKETNPENLGSYNMKTNKISMNDKWKKSKEAYSATIRHELGHAASVHLKGRDNINKDTEELRQRRRDIDTNKPETSTYRTGVKWTEKIHDRDQISLDKDNEALKNKARKALYKDYGAPDRSTMSDRDLGKAATGTIVPEETKMSIKEKFYDNLNVLREGLERGNPNIVKLNASRTAAKRALKHLGKDYDYEAAHSAVKGTALEKPLKSYLDRAQKHWTKMNVLNNSSRKAKSEEKYNDIRSRANDHQDQAQHHHDKAVEYLKSYSTMNEEAEQLDELNQSTKNRYVERSSKEETLATFGARHSSGKAKEKFQNVARKRRKGLSLALKRKEAEQLNEVTASINHKYVPEKWGEKSGKVKRILDSLEKAKIPHSVAHFGGDRNSGITYVTSDHPEFSGHMEKLAKKADTYDPQIYVHGPAEPKKKSSKKK